MSKEKKAYAVVKTEEGVTWKHQEAVEKEDKILKETDDINEAIEFCNEKNKPKKESKEDESKEEDSKEEESKEDSK